MKKLFMILSGSLLAIGGLCAQELAKIPIAIYLPEQVESIPATAAKSLTTKLKSATAQTGMGATDDFAQFYLTADATVLSRDVVPGAPPKFRQDVDVTLFVVDAFTQKVFNSTTLSTHGVGNSEAKSYIACFQHIAPTNKGLQSFLKSTNNKIAAYYESQIDHIIDIALALAKVYKYDEALFRLSLYPEGCAGYDRIVEVATGIYSKYIDDQANRNLAKARAIWNAGQNAAAAAEAGQYLAEILPEASCYKEAQALSEEIKARVSSDIDYMRSIEARDSANEHELALASVNAWRAVGVAFGNNQQAYTYQPVLIH